jgi:hypothetical protein
MDAKMRQAWNCIDQALRGLQFGEVKLIVQDGVVVQVERVERKRPARSPKKRG